jgi:hypothetical protein
MFEGGIMMEKIPRKSLRLLAASAATLLLAIGLGAPARADEAAAKSLVKAMSDYLAAPTTISFGYETNLFQLMFIAAVISVVALARVLKFPRAIGGYAFMTTKYAIGVAASFWFIKRIAEFVV